MEEQINIHLPNLNEEQIEQLNNDFFEPILDIDKYQIENSTIRKIIKLEHEEFHKNKKEKAINIPPGGPYHPAPLRLPPPNKFMNSYGQIQDVPCGNQILNQNLCEGNNYAFKIEKVHSNVINISMFCLLPDKAITEYYHEVNIFFDETLPISFPNTVREYYGLVLKIEDKIGGQNNWLKTNNILNPMRICFVPVSANLYNSKPNLLRNSFEAGNTFSSYKIHENGPILTQNSVCP